MTLLFENEKLVTEVRKHIFYFYTQCTGMLIAAVVPLATHRISIEFIPIQHTPSVVAFFVFCYALFLGMVWIYLFIAWTDYYLDTWLITDRRVIDFELKGLFHRDIASVDLANIQDIKIEINGMIEHMMKIGDVHVQTSGADKEFVIRGVRNPETVKQAIFGAMQTAKKV